MIKSKKDPFAFLEEKKKPIEKDLFNSRPKGPYIKKATATPIQELKPVPHQFETMTTFDIEKLWIENRKKIEARNKDQ